MAGGKAVLRAYEASSNIDSNTSQVRLQLYWENGDTKVSGVPWEAYIDYDGGKRLANSGTLTVEPNQTAMLIDQEVTIAHDGDGTRTVYYRGEFKNKSNKKVIPINNAALVLTTISRASYGADVTAEIAKPVTINITKREAWMRHSIWVRVGDWEQKIAGDDIDTSYTWIPPIEIANQFPNSASGQGTITYISYADGIERGRDIRKITVNVPTNLFKPGFTSFSLSDANPVTQNLIPSPTHFVSTLSRIKVVFNGGQGAAGSSITGYYAEIVSGNTSTQSNNGTLTVPSTMTDKQMTVRAKVQDSRGLWSDWREKTITVLAYFSPTLRFEVTRSGATNSTLTIKRFARVAPLMVNGVQKNPMKLTFTTRNVDSDTETIDNGGAGGTWSQISEFNASNANLGNTYPADTSYIVVGKLEDKFTSVSFQATVTGDRIVISYDKEGVGINKYRERGALDVDGLIYSNRKQIQHHKLTEPNGVAIDNKVANLNDYKTTGFYSIAGNYKNHPVLGENGFLEVVESGFGYHQTLTTVSGRMFKRTVTSNSAGTWIEYTPKPEKPEPAIIKRTVDFGWGINVFFVRKGSVVTASIIRKDSEVGIYEYGKMDNNFVPEGFRPSTEVHLVANKNISTGHAGVAVWHLSSDGSIRLTNQSKDRAVYTGTVTYITEDN